MKSLRQRLNRLEKLIEPEETDEYLLIYGKDKELIKRYEQITGKVYTITGNNKKQEETKIEEETTPELPTNVLPFHPLTKLDQLKEVEKEIHRIIDT